MPRLVFKLRGGGEYEHAGDATGIREMLDRFWMLRAGEGAPQVLTAQNPVFLVEPDAVMAIEVRDVSADFEWQPPEVGPGTD
jgi:hypothetical protein